MHNLGSGIPYGLDLGGHPLTDSVVASLRLLLYLARELAPRKLRVMPGTHAGDHGIVEAYLYS